MTSIEGIKKIVIILSIFILLSSTFLLVSAQEDSDGDTMPDDWEQAYGLDPMNATDADDDPDGDGLNNSEEYNHNTDPNNNDTDGGDVSDGYEVEAGADPLDPNDDDTIDSDSDRMPDNWETANQLVPTDPSDANEDADNDSYTNLEEYNYDTNPNDPQSKPKHPADEDDEGGRLELPGLGRSAFFTFFIIFIAFIVILILVLFVYTKLKREQLLEHRIRQQLYAYIQTNPGIHYRKIMNDLNLQMGTLTHHLNMLEQQQYIKSLQDGMYRRFYPFGVQPDTKLILSDIQARILDVIRHNPGISQINIAKNLGTARKVVNYHIKILADAGFIYVDSIGRESACYFKGET